jgi:hypothetical protein
MIVQSRWFRLVLILLTLATAIIWLVMNLVTVPHLQGLSGGLAIFDMRPLGYDLESAKTLLNALGLEGKSYYLDRQQALDSVFPALVFAMVAGWNIRLAAALKETGLHMPVPLVAAFVAIGLIGAVGDYGENGAVRQMLLAGANQISEAQVRAASAMDMTKFIFDIAAFLILMVQIALYSLRRRGKSPGSAQ